MSRLFEVTSGRKRERGKDERSKKDTHYLMIAQRRLEDTLGRAEQSASRRNCTTKRKRSEAHAEDEDRFYFSFQQLHCLFWFPYHASLPFSLLNSEFVLFLFSVSTISDFFFSFQGYPTLSIHFDFSFSRIAFCFPSQTFIFFFFRPLSFVVCSALRVRFYTPFYSERECEILSTAIQMRDGYNAVL